ncbi:MAG: S8 family serine peptidase, partial [Deltaproteobacteria bacterium]|nr:S8 family serine peptidase [Deltaproteobacteria bacterium]
MRKILYYLTSGIFLFTFSFPAAALGPAPVSAKYQAVAEGAEVAPGEYIVVTEASAANKARPFEVIHEDGDINDALKKIAKRDDVVRVEPNYIVHSTGVPDDPKFSDQWYLKNDDDQDIDANQAWEIQTGRPQIVIAVIDSGVDIDHPDIQGNTWTNFSETDGNGIDDDSNGFVDDYVGWDWVGDDNDPNPQPDGLGDDDGVVHGTHVAGIIGADTNNNLGVAGLTWNSVLMPLRVLNDEGSGTIADIAEAMRYAVDEGASIINLSLGTDSASSTLSDAVDYAHNNGLIVVAAAGNDSRNINTTPFYPICHDH